MLAPFVLGASALLCPSDDAASTDQLVATVPKGFEPVRTIEEGRKQTRTEVLHFTFSPDKTRVAYLAQKKRRIYAMIDEDDIGYGDDGNKPVFSGDGEHFAAALVKKGRNGAEKWSVYVDGKVIAREDWVGPLRLSGDGDTLAFWTQPDYRLDHEGETVLERNQLVIAHRKKKTFRQTRSEVYEWGNTYSAPLLVEDDTRAIGNAYDDRTGMIVSVGGKKDEVLQSREGYYLHPRYAPDAARIATVIRNYGGERSEAGSADYTPYEIEIDGLPFVVEADAWALPRFSPNGEHLAFVYHRYGLFGVGVNETLLPTREGVILQAVTDDSGTRIAYVLSEEGELDPGRWLYNWSANYVEGGMQRVMLADLHERESADAEVPTVEGPEYTKVDVLRFSPNGKRLAYLAYEEDGAMFLVCGGKRLGPADGMTAPEWVDDDTIVVGTREGREFWRRTLTLSED